jgi:hypothetical protein
VVTEKNEKIEKELKIAQEEVNEKFENHFLI